MGPKTPRHDDAPGQSPAMSGRARRIILGGLIVYGVVIMSFAWEGGDPYYNNDEPRHLLTGAFWADFFLERPIGDPVGFAKAYYAHYPGLGIVHWPPVFHLIEGAVFLIFGVSAGSAFGLMTAFFVVVLVGWWVLTERLVGPTTATFSTMLFPLAPEFFGLSGHVMLEVPALAWMILSLLAFERFLRAGRAVWLWTAAVCAVLAALTRVHGVIVLAPLLALWIGSGRRDLLRRKSVWAAALIACVLVGGYYGLTLTRVNAWSTMLARSPEFAWSDLGAPLLRSMGPVLVSLGGIGLLWVSARMAMRRPVPWVLVAWVGATLGMWLAVGYRPSRFLVYAWPALTTLGLFAITHVARAIGRPYAQPVVALLGLAVSAASLHSVHQPPLGGYREAAVAAMQATQTRRILFQGRIDGAFLWNVREFDPELEYTVFRASKVLAMGEDRLFKDYEALAETKEEIIRTLDELGVDVVVSEDLPEMDTPTFREFLRALEGDRFRELADFPIRNAAGRIHARRLKVLRFKRSIPARDELTLPMATLGPGNEFHIDLSRPLRGWSRVQ